MNDNVNVRLDQTELDIVQLESEGASLIFSKCNFNNSIFSEPDGRQDKPEQR